MLMALRLIPKCAEDLLGNLSASRLVRLPSLKCRTQIQPKHSCKGQLLGLAVSICTDFVLMNVEARMRNMNVFFLSQRREVWFLSANKN